MPGVGKNPVWIQLSSSSNKFVLTGGEAKEDTGAHQGIEFSTPKTHVKYLLSLWYKDIVEYLLNLRFPPHYDKTK